MTRAIHIHVEEPSMEAYLDELLPRLLLDSISFKIINHTNKQKLVRDVPLRLAGYVHIPSEYRPLTLVLVDRDADDCVALKAKLEAAARHAGLATKSNAGSAPFDVVNRIVIEELEAWHFGDIASLRAEFSGVPLNLGARAPFRDPDAIAGGTHEALLRVLQNAGHFQGMATLPKVDTARRLARIVDIEGNRSASFQQFVAGLAALADQLTEAELNG